MKVSELMAGRTPSPTYEGPVSNDDMVLAVDCGATAATEITAATVADFAVVAVGTTGVEAQLNPTTQDKTYLRSGQTTTKTGNQRSFKVSGDKFVGDAFQDFVLSHAVKYGMGKTVVRSYVFFNLLTGNGESGKMSIIVNSDGSGNAGESASIDVELKKFNETPAEYTYAAPVGG